MRAIRRVMGWVVTLIVLLVMAGYGLYAANGIRDEHRLRARHERREPSLAETATAVYARLTLVAEPTATLTPTATATATASATASPTSTPTASATATASRTPSITPSATPPRTPTARATMTAPPPPSITPIPTNTPRFTATPAAG